jgi:hypothetical protein
MTFCHTPQNLLLASLAGIDSVAVIFTCASDCNLTLSLFSVPFYLVVMVRSPAVYP